MDFVVRFLHGRRIATRYLKSSFLGHTRAKDILEHFKKGLEEFNATKILQISMDGPKTNLKFFKDFTEDRGEDLPKLLDLGTCSLHVIHGAFTTGIQKTGWGLDVLLRSLYYLFDHSPARSEDYTEIMKSNIFPLPFCSTRWVEDQAVAKRAIEIWPNIVKYVKETEKKPKSQIPKIASYEKVRDAVLQDRLIIAKLEVFVSTAALLKPFLTKYQTEWPMIPFLVTDVEGLLRNVLSKIVKPTVLSNSKLASIELKEENLLLAKNCTISFAANNAVKDAKPKETEKLAFFVEFRNMNVALVNKIFERSPVKNSLAKALIAINPQHMAAHPTTSVTKFKHILDVLQSSKWKDPRECDVLLQSFQTLMHDKDFIKECKSFDASTTRLDDFFFDSGMNKKDEYKALLKVFMMMLSLSHGQADIERGFSVNKDLVQPNMQQNTLVAKRLVYSSLTAAGVKSAADFVIPPALKESCRHARMRYSAFLDDEKKKNEKEKKKRKRDELNDELETAVKRKKEMEKEVQNLLDEADQKADKAAKKRDFSLLHASNALRLKAKEQSKEIKIVDKQIESLRQRQCLE